MAVLFRLFIVPWVASNVLDVDEGLAHAFAPVSATFVRSSSFSQIGQSVAKEKLTRRPVPSICNQRAWADERWSTPTCCKPIYMNAGSDDIEYAKADDGEALQALFSKQCDGEGLMTKDELKTVPAIAELLADGDLMLDELDDIWNAAPKFPDLNASGSQQDDRIDVDSFIQIYRDIDDLFEDDDDEVAKNVEGTSQLEEKTEAKDDSKNAEETDDAEDDEEQTIARDEKELELAFKTICDADGLVSREKLRQWDEVSQLLDEGLLGEDEFQQIWDQTSKRPGLADQLDVDGFLSFNVALDDLFVFDEDEELRKGAISESEGGTDENSDDIALAAGQLAADVVNSKAGIERGMVTGDDLPPGVIFAELSGDDFLVGMEELKRWGELQEMLADEDLLPVELQNIFDGVPKARGTSDRLDEEGFLELYESIESLFEDDEDDESANTESAVNKEAVKNKAILLGMIADLEKDKEQMPCGLDCTEMEQSTILKVVAALEAEPSNLIISTKANIQETDLAGTWDLLYSSSSAMKFNKGLSGLGGSFPNGKFGGLQQKLQASKYMTDVEYIERIEVNPGTNSFDVRVTGDWELRSSVSLFTGEPSIVMSVTPDRVMYGPTSTRADHWKSLGPLNLLDITYLDDDLRIMRGNTATDNIFIFKRNP